MGTGEHPNSAKDPGQSTDSELVLRSTRGDERAFALLVGRYRRLLDAACATACPHLQEREDAMQQALVDIWRGLAGFKGESAISTWMFRVAQNAARREARRNRRSPGPYTDDADEEVLELRSAAAEWGDALDTKSAILDALRGMPANHRDALLLHVQAGLSLQEIADMQYAALGTVKAWIHRARSEITRSLEAASQ